MVHIQSFVRVVSLAAFMVLCTGQLSSQELKPKDSDTSTVEEESEWYDVNRKTYLESIPENTTHVRLSSSVSIKKILHLKELTALDWRHFQLDKGTGLAQLAKFKKLEELRLHDDGGLTKAGYETISELTTLKKLVLDYEF